MGIGTVIELEAESFARERARHWDRLTAQLVRGPGWSGTYHRRLRRIYRNLIPPGHRVLEVGCGNGDLLAALEPREGVGIDFSAAAIAEARSRHPQLDLRLGAADDLESMSPFDYVVLSDLVNELWDVEDFLQRLRAVCTRRTRIILNTYSHLWEWPLRVAQSLRLARRARQPNWLAGADITNLLALGDFEVVRTFGEILLPLPIPLLEPLCNRFLVRLPGLRWLALSHFTVARPLFPNALPVPEPSVSIIAPARNEAGNVADLVERLPLLGHRTELLFVEGGSTDDTRAVIERTIADAESLDIRLILQPGRGKWDAVQAGFAAATGDVLIILDTDLAVAPEDLPRFYRALTSGKGDFVNGVRLVYPMDEEAMRFANLVGNKLFTWVVSWLLGQPVKDTLCGTKVLWREDYPRMLKARSELAALDPFGDFFLLLGASTLHLKIVDLPIRYRERVYGATNISRWRHGLVLLRFVIQSAVRHRLY